MALARLSEERSQLIDKIRFYTPDDTPGSASRVAFAQEKCAREVLQLGKAGEIVYRV